jgi:hypothetical protein
MYSTGRNWLLNVSEFNPQTDYACSVKVRFGHSIVPQGRLTIARQFIAGSMKRRKLFPAFISGIYFRHLFPAFISGIYFRHLFPASIPGIYFRHLFPAFIPGIYSRQ